MIFLNVDYIHHSTFLILHSTLPPMRIIIDDKIPYIREAASALGDAIYLPGSEISAADVRNADALIVRTRTRCDRELLQGSQVQMVATATIGFDHIDTAYLQQAGIAWTNCPGCNADSVAQYVQSALYLLQDEGYISLSAAVVGIVGIGHVGSSVERKLHEMGCTILRHDPPRAERGETGFVGMDEIVRRCDVITFHTPLTRQGAHPTYHMADATFFASLQRKPVIINAARGEVVNQVALKQALQQGKVCAAVIDTWENEPCIDRALLECTFLATPHIAGYSADGKANGTRMALQAVAQHFNIPFTAEILPPQLPNGYAYYPEKFNPQHPHSAALRLYDPRRDSDALKQHPEWFEKLRGNYPLRRESF